MVCGAKKSQFYRLLSAITLLYGLIFAYQVTAMNQMPTMNSMMSGQVIGNLMKSGGWYERYPNGQIVLYLIVNPPTHITGSNNALSMNTMVPINIMGMSGMSGMLSMPGGMSGMFAMPGGMPGGMGGMLGMPGGMSGMLAMPGGMGGMLGMLGGMGGMSGMSMPGISSNYQMTFGKFKIDQDGNLVLYPFHNPLNLWEMDNINGMGQIKTP